MPHRAIMDRVTGRSRYERLQNTAPQLQVPARAMVRLDDLAACLPEEGAQPGRRMDRVDEAASRPESASEAHLTSTCAMGILPQSMILRSAQFRSLTAVLLTVAIPFCCCNFRSLLAGNLACESAFFAKVGVARASLNPTKAHGCCHGKSVSDGVTSDFEPTSDTSDQPRDCSCDKSGGKVLSVEKPGLELPAQVLVAVLEWVQWPELRLFDPVIGRGQLPHAVHRPLTSLVRMHCALIV